MAQIFPKIYSIILLIFISINLISCYGIFIEKTDSKQTKGIAEITNSSLKEKDVCILNYTLFSDGLKHNTTIGRYYMGSIVPDYIKESYIGVQALHEWFWQELLGSEINSTVIFSKSAQWSADNLAPSNPVYGKYLRFDVLIMDIELSSEEAVFDIEYLLDAFGSLIKFVSQPLILILLIPIIVSTILYFNYDKLASKSKSKTFFCNSCKKRFTTQGKYLIQRDESTKILVSAIEGLKLTDMKICKECGTTICVSCSRKAKSCPVCKKTRYKLIKKKVIN